MYCIITNPIAGKGRTLGKLPLLLKAFDNAGLQYESHITQHIMHGYEIAKTATKNHLSGIIGMGGDGTFQEIVAGMADAGIHGEKIPVPLGIYPAGSGNDFVMTLHGDKKTALAKYKNDGLEDFIQSIYRKTRPVDLITANGMAYLNIGNIGLDARIVANACAIKGKYGRHAYVAATYKSIAQHKNLTLKIKIDGNTIEKPFTLVAVCNGRYYGGGLHITPSARLDDGKITLCLITGMSRPKTMILFPSLMLERHTGLKAISFVECKDLIITLPSDEKLCLDGNLYDRAGEIHFKILPQVLDIFI